MRGGRLVTWVIALTVLGAGAGYAEKRAGFWAVAQDAPLSAAQEHALKPMDAFKECGICPVMVVVPAGSFIMGSPADETNRETSEGPQHQVTFARQFAVGRFAVTFEEWDACVADGGCNGYRPKDEGWGRGRRPAINVSWDDAKAYVAWLSKKTGKTYRLLSEAEREYVTRAGTTTPFWWGTSIATSQANYDGAGTYGGGPKGEVRHRTVPVDSFLPNPWGLYQVHGNVSEWVEDCWHESYDGAPSNGSSWTSGNCIRRVTRGGSWFNPPVLIRSAARWGYGPFGRLPTLGFRAARALSAEAITVAPGAARFARAADEAGADTLIAGSGINIMIGNDVDTTFHIDNIGTNPSSIDVVWGKGGTDSLNITGVSKGVNILRS